MSPDILSSVPDLLSGILLSSWQIFVEASPYLIFGFAVAGILNVLVLIRRSWIILARQQEKFVL